MGGRVAKQVKKMLKGEFDSRNRSALEMMVREALKDNARELCDSIVPDSNLAERALGVAMEIAEARRTARASSHRISRKPVQPPRP
jgi:hypothetical protein